MLPAWALVDFELDEYTPRKQPEYPHWAALDCFYLIQFCLVVFLLVVMDSKLLHNGMRTRVDMETRLRGNPSPRNRSYDEELTLAYTNIADAILSQLDLFRENDGQIVY